MSNAADKSNKARRPNSPLSSDEIKSDNTFVRAVFTVPFGKLIDEEVEADASQDEQSSEMRRRVLTAWKRLISSRLVCNLPACCYPNRVS